MIRQLDQPDERLQPLWWLAPATLFCLVVGSTMAAAAWQSDAAYRLYGTPKFIATKHLLLAGGIIVAFAIGSRLASVTGKKPTTTPESAERYIAIWFWISVVLTLFGYAAWISVAIKNGFSLAAFRELLTTDDPHFAEELHLNVFNTVQGVTTCTQFGLAAVPMGIWLFFRGHRQVILAIAGLFGLAFLRAIVFSERLAVIELLVPAAVVTLRMGFLGQRCSGGRRWLFELAPILGIVSLLVFFGGFEYFRSWRYYRYEFDSFSQFILWRFAGYYTTAHNNSAMALETRDTFPLPFMTVQSLWILAGLFNKSLRYTAVTGVDPDSAHLAMLDQFGTAELNNEGGLFQPALDFGLAGMLLFWCVCGFVSGRAYRAFLAGNMIGILFYPLFFLAILETPRFLYLTYTRALPPLAMFLLVAWIAATFRRTSRVPALGPAPA
ncbi:MAG TPA: oligosaccharide repeat unit polymerase [Pirellulaceae bacterium]|jgi:oligosaccharide repeat unit polymerase